MVWSNQGLNGMSRQLHALYRTRLARGYWRNRERPVLINNWEATMFDYVEDDLVRFAQKVQECGIELFVLDDGWFGRGTEQRPGRSGGLEAQPRQAPQRHQGGGRTDRGVGDEVRIVV